MVLVIGPVVDGIIPKRHIAHGKVVEVPAVGGFKSGHGDVGPGVKLLGDAPGDAVQLHAVQFGRSHSLRQKPEEIPHAAGRFQDVAAGKAHIAHGLIDGLNDGGAGVVGVQDGGPRRFVFLRSKQHLQFLVLVRPIRLIRVKGICQSAPAHIAGEYLLFLRGSGPPVKFDLMQGGDGLGIHAELCFRPALAQMIVCDVEILRGVSLLRLGLLRFVNGQALNDNVKGQAVLIAGVNGGGPRRNLRRGGQLRLLGEQMGVAVVLTYSVLEEIPADGLIAPGVGAGVDTNIQIPDIADSAADLTVAVLEGNLIPHLIGGCSLQPDRFPLDRHTGKAVQFLLPQRTQHRGDLMPGVRRTRNFHFIIVQNFYPHGEAGCEIVRHFAGGKLRSVYTVAQKSRQQTAHFPIAFSGSKIFDDLISVLVGQ